MTQCLCHQLLNVVLYSLQDNPEETAMFYESLPHWEVFFVSVVVCVMYSFVDSSMLPPRINFNVYSVNSIVLIVIGVFFSF